MEGLPFRAGPPRNGKPHGSNFRGRRTMSKSKKRQLRLAAKTLRAYQAKPCVEQLENRELPSTTHLLASMIHATGLSSNNPTVSLAAVGPVTPTDPRFASQWDL